MSSDNFDAALKIGIGLNLTFVVLELAAGWRGNSLALIADASHNFGDVVGLALAWGAVWLSRFPPTPRRTFGWGKVSILAALVNGALLIAVGCGIIAESIQRWFEPRPPAGWMLIAVAAAGVAVNTASAALFFRGRHHDLNQRGAFLHLAADAAVSLGVVCGGVIIWLTGAAWVDPAFGLVIAAVILLTSHGLFSDALNLALDAVPARIDPVAVKKMLAGQAAVIEVRNLRIWALSTSVTAITARMIIDPAADQPALHAVIRQQLHDRFGITDVTLQLETRPSEPECSAADTAIGLPRDPTDHRPLAERLVCDRPAGRQD